MMALVLMVGDRRRRRGRSRTLEQVENRLCAASSQRRARVGGWREGEGMKGGWGRECVVIVVGWECGGEGCDVDGEELMVLRVVGW